MAGYVQEQAPSLVLVASERLASSGSAGLGSLSLTFVKAVTGVPILVVKRNSMG